MHAYIKVENGVAGISIHSGMGLGNPVKLTGTTFSLLPVGTTVENLSFRVPEGLNAVAVFCAVIGPREKGSGPTRRLEHDEVYFTDMLLSWFQDGKAIVKSTSDMSPTELGQFNGFVRLDIGIMVSDSERKVAYIASSGPMTTIDPKWAYKTVSMEAILEYITKKLTMEELDQRATSEQQAYDELMEAKGNLCVQTNTIDHLTAKVRGLQTDNNFLEERRETAVAAQNELVGLLMKSQRVYSLLKRLPVWSRKPFSGFIEAMDVYSAPKTSVEKSFQQF